MLSVIKQTLIEAHEIHSSTKKSDSRLATIYEYLKTNDYIMNNDVQKLLNVSSATATRILTSFAKTGELKRIRIGSHWGYIKE